MALVSVAVLRWWNTSIGLELVEEEIFLLHVLPTEECLVDKNSHGLDVFASDLRPMEGNVTQNLHVDVETIGVDQRETKGDSEALCVSKDVGEDSG